MAEIAAYGRDLATGSYRVAGPADEATDTAGDRIGTALPTRYVEGLQVVYTGADTFSVSQGQCRDNADAGDIQIATSATGDKTASGIGGVDSLTLTGTGTKTAGGLTGSGTAFLTEFGTAALTGTVSTTGTAVTGTGTLFASGELSVGDLIGNASNGYSRVTAIDSDTSATLSAAIPGGDLSSASTNRIENATVECVAEIRRVDTITSNTALTVSAAWTTSAAGQTITAGTFVADQWAAAWVVSGTSGSGAVVSTQRTTLLNPPTGYTTSERRVGWLRINSSGNFLRYRYSDGGLTRRVNIPEPLSLIINAATGSLAWTRLPLEDYFPPTCRLGFMSLLEQVNTVGSVTLSFREPNVSTGFADESLNVPIGYEDTATASNGAGAFARVTLDGAQATEYRVNGDAILSLDEPFGFIDTL